jgi:hypothetical protein
VLRMTARSEFEDQKANGNIERSLDEVKLALSRAGDTHGFREVKDSAPAPRASPAPRISPRSYFDRKEMEDDIEEKCFGFSRSAQDFIGYPCSHPSIMQDALQPAFPGC